MAFEYAPLIEKYGYLATFAGSLIEGETLLILSGLAAHRGYLDLLVVVLVGAVGGALGDLGFFLVGRLYGERVVQRLPRLQPGFDRVRGMIERYPTATIFGVRFLYGLRLVGPMAIGSARISLLRFMVVNVAGALVWSACWVGAGYFLGHAAERLLGELARYEGYFFAALLVTGVIVALVVRWCRRSNP
jgi:membrane protein DedA with SNARE-associated domain